jgi:hypothetical protein
VSPLPASRSDLREQRFTCPSGDESLLVRAPAHAFDLAFSADGFIPMYRWATALVAGKTLDADTVELKRGDA